MITLNPERQKQIEYIGITEDDVEYLTTQEQAFKNITNRVVDELYARILRQPELAEIIEKHSTLDRLKGTQVWYFESMVTGVIDQQFIERVD